jgi:6-phosphogluconate dehydrogenase (decarboxylating)
MVMLKADFAGSASIPIRARGRMPSQRKDPLMQIGLIGLGRMGANMSRRLLRDGHSVVGYARTEGTVTGLVSSGAISTGAASLQDLVAKLSVPRVVWLMVPAASVDATLADLVPLLSNGDIVVDGGNSYYVDDIRRSKSLASQHIDYLDCGTSGGVYGLERGYSLMIGGAAAAVERLDPIFRSLAPGVESAPRTPWPNRRADDGRERLPALRTERRGPFRQDGPQRHRVRADGRVRRGAQHPEPRQRRVAPA